MIIKLLSVLKAYGNYANVLDDYTYFLSRYSQSIIEAQRASLRNKIERLQNQFENFANEFEKCKNSSSFSTNVLTLLNHSLEEKKRSAFTKKVFVLFDELSRKLNSNNKIDQQYPQVKEEYKKLLTRYGELPDSLYKELNGKWELVRTEANEKNLSLPPLSNLGNELAPISEHEPLQNENLCHDTNPKYTASVLKNNYCMHLINLEEFYRRLTYEQNSEVPAKLDKEISYCLEYIKAIQPHLEQSYKGFLTQSDKLELKKHERSVELAKILWIFHVLKERLDKLDNSISIEKQQLITTIENQATQAIEKYVCLLIEYKGLPYNLYQELSSKWKSVLFKHSALHPGILEWSLPNLSELTCLIGIPPVWIDFEQPVVKLGIEFTPESIRRIQTSLLSLYEKLKDKTTSYDDHWNVIIYQSVYCEISCEILLTIITTQTAELKNGSIIPLQKKIMDLIYITYGISEENFEVVVYKNYEQLLKFLLNYAVSSGYDINIVKKLLQLCKQHPKVIEEIFIPAMDPIFMTDNYLVHRLDNEELESELQCKEEIAKSILDQSGACYYNKLVGKLFPESRVPHSCNKIRAALLCLLKLIVENRDRMIANEDITDFIARQFKEFFEENSVNHVSKDFSSFLEKCNNFASVIQQYVMAKIYELAHNQEALEQFAQNDKKSLLNDVHNFFLLECGQGWTDKLEYLLIVISHLLENNNSKNIFKQVNAATSYKFLQTLFDAQRQLGNTDDLYAKKFILLRIAGDFLNTLPHKVLNNVLTSLQMTSLQNQNKKTHFSEWLKNTILIQDNTELTLKINRNIQSSINIENLQQELENTHSSDFKKVQEEILCIVSSLFKMFKEAIIISNTINDCIRQQTRDKNYVIYEKVSHAKQKLADLTSEIPSCRFYLFFLKKTGINIFSTIQQYFDKISANIKQCIITISKNFRLDIQSYATMILQLLPDDNCGIVGIGIIKNVIENLIHEEKSLKPNSRPLLSFLIGDLYVVVERTVKEYREDQKHEESANHQTPIIALRYVTEWRKSKDTSINIIDYSQLHLDIFTMIIAQSDITRVGELRNDEFYSAQVMFSDEECRNLMDRVGIVLRNETNRDFPNQYTYLDALKNAIQRADSGTIRKIYIRGGWNGDESEIKKIFQSLIQESDHATLRKVLIALEEKIKQSVIQEMFCFACVLLLNNLDNFEKKLKLAKLLFDELKNDDATRARKSTEDLFEIMREDLFEIMRQNLNMSFETTTDSPKLENIKILIYIALTDFLIKSNEFRSHYHYNMATVKFRNEISPLFKITKTDNSYILQLKDENNIDEIFMKCCNLEQILKKSRQITAKQLTEEINDAIDNLIRKFEREKVDKVKSILNVYYQCLSEVKTMNINIVFNYIKTKLPLTNEEFEAGIDSLSAYKKQIEDDFKSGIEDEGLEVEKIKNLQELTKKIELLRKSNSETTSSSPKTNNTTIPDIDQKINDYKQSSIRDFLFTRSEFLLLLECTEKKIKFRENLLPRHNLKQIEDKIRNFVSTINKTFPLTEEDFQEGLKALENEIANPDKQYQKLLENSLCAQMKKARMEKARNEIHGIRKVKQQPKKEDLQEVLEGLENEIANPEQYQKLLENLLCTLMEKENLQEELKRLEDEIPNPEQYQKLLENSLRILCKEEVHDLIINIKDKADELDKMKKNRLRILHKEKARDEISSIRENVKKLLNNYSDLKTFLEKMPKLIEQRKVNKLDDETYCLHGESQIIDDLFGDKEKLYDQLFNILSNIKSPQFLFTDNYVSIGKDNLETILIILLLMQKYSTFMLRGSEEEKFLADPDTNFMGDIRGEPVCIIIGNVVTFMPRSLNAISRSDKVSQNQILDLLRNIFSVLPKQALLTNGEEHPHASIFCNKNECTVSPTYIDVFKSASDDKEMWDMLDGLLANLILKQVNKEVWRDVFFDYMRIKYGEGGYNQDNIIEELNFIVKELCEIGFIKEILEPYCKEILSDFKQPDIEEEPLINRCYRFIGCLWEQGEVYEELDTEMIESMRALFREYKKNVEFDTLALKLWNIILKARLKERRWIPKDIDIEEPITLRQTLAGIEQQVQQQPTQSCDQKDSSPKTILTSGYSLVKDLSNLDLKKASKFMSKLTEWFSKFSCDIQKNAELLLAAIGELLCGKYENFSLETRQVTIQKLFLLIQLKRYLNLDELHRDIDAIIKGIESLEEREQLRELVYSFTERVARCIENKCHKLKQNELLSTDIKDVLDRIQHINQILCSEDYCHNVHETLLKLLFKVLINTVTENDGNILLELWREISDGEKLQIRKKIDKSTAEKISAVIEVFILSKEISFETKNKVCSALLEINPKENNADLNQSILNVVQDVLNMHELDKQQLIFESPKNTEYQELKHIILRVCAEVDLPKFIEQYSRNITDEYDTYLLTFITQFNDLLCKKPNLNKLKTIPPAFITLLRMAIKLLNDLESGLQKLDEIYQNIQSRIERVMDFDVFFSSVDSWLQNLNEFKTETQQLPQQIQYFPKQAENSPLSQASSTAQTSFFSGNRPTDNQEESPINGNAPQP